MSYENYPQYPPYPPNGYEYPPYEYYPQYSQQWNEPIPEESSVSPDNGYYQPHWSPYQTYEEGPYYHQPWEVTQNDNYEAYPNTYEVPSMEESHIVEEYEKSVFMLELVKQAYELKASFDVWLQSKQQDDGQLGEYEIHQKNLMCRVMDVIKELHMTVENRVLTQVQQLGNQFIEDFYKSSTLPIETPESDPPAVEEVQTPNVSIPVGDFALDYDIDGEDDHAKREEVSFEASFPTDEMIIRPSHFDPFIGQDDSVYDMSYLLESLPDPKDEAAEPPMQPILPYNLDVVLFPVLIGPLGEIEGIKEDSECANVILYASPPFSVTEPLEKELRFHFPHCESKLLTSPIFDSMDSKDHGFPKQMSHLQEPWPPPPVSDQVYLDPFLNLTRTSSSYRGEVTLLISADLEPDPSWGELGMIFMILIMITVTLLFDWKDPQKFRLLVYDRTD